jgi:hypothetical protein
LLQFGSWQLLQTRRSRSAVEVLATDAYTLDRERMVAGAQAILNGGHWCGLEVCVDPAAQRWELRAIVPRDDPEDVADAITRWLLRDDGADWRLRGCPRSLRGQPSAIALLIHVAAEPGAEGQAVRHQSRETGGLTCWCAMA